MPVTVLYEDSRGERQDFGLHDFVCQCVIDRALLARDLYEVRKSLIRPVPVKGERECSQTLPKGSEKAGK